MPHGPPRARAGFRLPSLSSSSSSGPSLMRRASLSLVRGLSLIATAATSRPSSHCHRGPAAAPSLFARAPTPSSSSSSPPNSRFAAALAASAPRQGASGSSSQAKEEQKATKGRRTSTTTSSSTTRRKKTEEQAMDAPTATAATAARAPATAEAAAAPKRARTPPPPPVQAAGGGPAPPPATKEATSAGNNNNNKRQKAASGVGGGGGKKAEAAAGAAQRQAAARVFAACKLGDAALALARFEELLAAGHRADGHLYNTMIHVCAGLWDWEALARTRASERAAAAAGGGSSADGSDGGVRGEAFFGGALPLVPLIRVHQYEGGNGGGGGGGSDGQQQQQQQQQPQPQQQKNREAAPPPPPPPPLLPPLPPEELARRADDFWQRMQAAGFPAEESTYTHLARIAAMRGDADAALAHARTVAAAHRAALAGERPRSGGRPMVARLRTYQPALLACALKGDTAAVRAIDAELQGLGIDLTEGELALLLEAAGRGGDAALGAEALHRMTHELARLSEPAAEVARRFFLSPAASASDAVAVAPDPAAVAGAAGAANGNGNSSNGGNNPLLAGKRPRSWAVERTSSVDPATGACTQAGGAARLVDLSDADWESFAAAVRDLALKSAKAPDAFSRFVEWEARHGPFDRCIDAANVALFGQNYGGGAFRVEQVRRVHAALAAADAAAAGAGAAAADGKEDGCPNPSGGGDNSTSSRTLVVLHVRRKGEPSARQRDNAAWLDDLARRRRFWWAPPGSNDDWYWLYASVRARGRGMLVTNDEMRDHVFQLLRPKHFLKWKERHVVRYDFGGEGAARAPGGPSTGGAPRLFFPRPFTACVQRVDATGAWMIPVVAGGGGSSAGAAGAAAAGGGGGGGGGGEEALAAEAAAGGAGEWIVARPVYD